MENVSNIMYGFFSSPIGIAGFICGAVLLYLVISRTLKKRNEN